MQEKRPRRGIQPVDIAFRVPGVLQKTPQATALKDIAPRAELTASAANNDLVGLVRIGLAAADEKPRHYRLGAGALFRPIVTKLYAIRHSDITIADNPERLIVVVRDGEFILRFDRIEALIDGLAAMCAH